MSEQATTKTKKAATRPRKTAAKPAEKKKTQAAPDPEEAKNTTAAPEGNAPDMENTGGNNENAGAGNDNGGSDNAAGNNENVKTDPKNNESGTDTTGGNTAHDTEEPQDTDDTPESGAHDTENAADGWEVARVLKVTKPLMKGDDVKALQAALIAHNYHCGATGIDGVYGRNTAYAVRCFQSANRLVVDGKAGRYTVAALGGV